MVRDPPPPPGKSFCEWDSVENIEEPERPQGQLDACAYHAGYQKLQAYTLGMCIVIAFLLQHGNKNMPECYVTAFLVCYVAELCSLM
jgi:hypothetical protein